MISTLEYIRRDVLALLFGIQCLVLSLKGTAWFVSGITSRPRISLSKAKSMREKYFWAIVAAALFAGAIWDLSRKFPQ